MKEKRKMISLADERRLASFTELNPRPVVEVDLEGNILYRNPAARAIFPDLPRRRLAHPYLADFAHIVTFLKKSKTREAFSRYVKIGDRWFRHFFYYMPEFRSVLIYGSDITDRMASDLALRESELRHRSLFSQMGEGYALYEILFDRQGHPKDYRFLELNRAFEKISGVIRKQAAGKTVRQLFGAKAPEWVAGASRRLAVPRPSPFEYHNPLNDRHYEVLMYRIGQNQCATIFFDITDRKQSEEEKDRFISIMSHELRNPLTPVVAAARLMHEMVQDAPKDSARAGLKKYANIISRQAGTMASLLDDLLDSARISHQRMRLNLQVVEVQEVLHHALETLEPIIAAQRHRAFLDIPRQPLRLHADPVRLEQIMVNLISNAAKYTKPGGRIWMSLKSHGDSVVISVRDNGLGISPQKRKEIFTLFNQSEHLPFAAIGSLGVGLNLTKNLVVLHGGKIRVTSRGLRQGSCFTVTIPGIVRNAPQTKKREDAQKDAAQKVRVLIAEDNRDISALLADGLRRHGHTVRTAASGPRAVSLAKSFSPQVALVDIGLGAMNGYEVARRLRRQHGKKIFLVAVTGYGQKKDIEEAQRAGFDYHLAKPVDLAQLISCIREI